MKKRVFGLTIMLIFFIAGTVMAGEKEAVLQPSEAIDLALENSVQLKIAEKERDNAEINYEISKAEELDSRSRYDRLQAELDLDRARENYESEKEDLIITVVEDYMEIMSRQKELKIMEKQEELRKSQLEIAESQYESDHIGQLDLTDARHDLENIESDLKYNRRELERLKEEYREKLGFEKEGVLKLEEIESPEVMEGTEEEIIEEIEANSFNLEVEKREKELAEIDKEKGEASGASSLELSKLENDLDVAEHELTEARRDVHSSALSQYNSFRRAAERMKMSKEELEQEKENFDISRKQHQSGSKSETELLTAEVELLEAESSYNDAVVEYLSAELKLKQSLGQDLGSEYDDQLAE
ncbi:MAG: TolC family protein [Halanaerobiaceae bacterium]